MIRILLILGTLSSKALGLVTGPLQCSADGIAQIAAVYSKANLDGSVIDQSSVAVMETLAIKSTTSGASQSAPWVDVDLPIATSTNNIYFSFRWGDSRPADGKTEGTLLSIFYPPDNSRYACMMQDISRSS